MGFNTPSTAMNVALIRHHEIVAHFVMDTFLEMTLRWLAGKPHGTRAFNVFHGLRANFSESAQ